ncbi:MAG: SMC-Scp complex subunit ScpB, partial [Candidatus Omnitrophota bacterium]
MQEEKTLDKKDKPVTQAADQAFVGPEAESGSIKSMMGEDELKSVIEALIFASDKPLAIKQIKDIVGDVDTRLIRNLVNGLKQEFTAGGRSFNICEVAGGFQFMTGPAYGRWLKKLYKIKMSDYLTGPSLETIAIIAYRQPVTKADIEFIRGVAVDGVINSLQQKGLIKVAGKKDVVGKPYLYGTTALFLQYFGLNSIDELPALSDFKVSDLE